MHAGTELADRYLLRRRLASGGMGEVWLADDTRLGRQVAVKLLPMGAESPPAAVERFHREARTMAALQHPNIVTIFDSGTRSGAAFIVMELLPGPTVDRLLAERGPLPEAEAVRLAGEVAAGLTAAHQAGVVHRDIKPSNLMFSAAGTLKVLDFGIARLGQTTTSGLTAPDAVIGSAPYLSPEQAAGNPVDERTDLYALGCVLMAMVAGRPPFTAEHPVAVLHQQVHNYPPLLRDLQPTASPALEQVVARLLSKRPDDRPGTAAEVVNLLAGLATPAADRAGAAPTRVLPVGAPPTVTALQPPATLAEPTRVAPAPPAPPGPPRADADPSRRRGGRWGWLAAAALIAIVALTALALSTLPDRRGEQAAPIPGPTGPAATTTSPAPDPTPTPTAAATSPDSTPPTVAAEPGSAVEAVRDAVAATVADGAMDPKRADQFGRRLDDLDKRLAEGGRDVAKQVEDLSRRLDDYVRKGELTEDGRRRIQAALDDL